MRLAKLCRRVFTSALGCGLLALGLAASAQAQCSLNSPSGKIKHVVFVEFDNVHFTRDNPNVPSDLEQMPNLLNFLEGKGTLDAGDHTVLISHTANDILTTQTGLYSDNQGVFIGNSFGVFAPNPKSPFEEVGMFPSAFFYWTDKVSDITPSTNDNTFALTTPTGANVTPPWEAFTQHGCTVGAFSTANIVLERTPFDVAKVFGAGSPQALESTSTAVKPNQTDDFEGAAIHCALNDPICKTNGAVVAVPDTLPSDPSYTGYQALFGLKYVNPALNAILNLPGGVINDYHGVPITGFQSLAFDPTPAQTLAVVEDMLKAGIPVVYAYIADAHDNQAPRSLNPSTESTFGPGEIGYVDQLADYNSAFGTFFQHLKEAGINESNTLFIFTPDEGDHFAGVAATPSNCDGAKIEKNGAVVPDVPCTYPAANGQGGVGELDVNLGGVTASPGLTNAAGNSTVYGLHFDDAATTYVDAMPPYSSSIVRGLEQTMASISVVNPHTGLSENLLGTGLGPALQGAIADPAAMHLIHMNSTFDPNREPTFTFFGDPNFFFENGSSAPAGSAVSVGTGFAWNHGDIQPEIAQTFIGMVGPGVKNLGATSPTDFFTDHVDLRPTMMMLLGLTDSYQHDGRVITEILDESVLPHTLRGHRETMESLGQVYKQIDAPFGELATNTLTVSTYAITTTSTGDAVYNNLENTINTWTSERDGLASQIKTMLEGAEFNEQPLDEKLAKDVIAEAQALLDQSNACTSNLAKCAK